MAFTYSKIAEYTVGASAVASIVFTGIPQNYTDLVIKFSARGDRASTTDLVRVFFNGTTTGYSNRHLQGDGPGVSTGSASYVWAYQANGATATSNTFGNGDVYIPNYTSSNNKSISAEGVQENNTTSAYMGMTANLWSNTTAINSITLTLDSGSSFTQYTTVYIYGIRAGEY